MHVSVASAAGMAALAGERRPHAAIAFLLFLCVLAPLSAARELTDPDEGRYAAVAQAMAQSGDYVVPRLQGMPFADKPPLVYWVQCAAAKVVGDGPLAARSPILLAGALWSLFILLLAWEWSASRRVAWIAGAMGVTCVAGVVGSRVGPQMDMPLAAAIAGALFAATRALDDGGWRARVGLGVAVGLGLLTKGPLVVAVPLLVALAWWLGGVQAGRLLRVIGSPLSVGVALVIALPWHVAIERALPGWNVHFLFHEHFGRFAREDHRSFHPFWFYVPVLALYLLPWTPLLWVREQGRRGIGAVLHSLPWSVAPFHGLLRGTRPWGAGAAPVRCSTLAYGWLVAAFLLYSISTRKLLLYLLPAALPAVVLCAAHLALGGRRPLRRTALVLLLLGVGSGAAAVLIHLGVFLPLSTGNLPSALEAPRHAALAPWLALAGVLFCVAALCAWQAARGFARGTMLAMMMCVALAWAALECGVSSVPSLRSARELGAAVERHVKAPQVLISLNRFPQGLSLYTSTPLQVAGGSAGAFRQREIVEPFATRHWQQQSQLPPEQRFASSGLVTDAEFLALWEGTQRVWVICRWAEVRGLRGYIASGPHGGAGRSDLFLVSNQPLEAQ